MFLGQFVLCVLLFLLATNLYDSYVAHESPAFPLPQWSAAPFFIAVYAVFGASSYIWNKRGSYLSSIPALFAFFLALGGIRTGSDYYPASFFDYIGRPSVAATAVGFSVMVAAAGGWHLAKYLFGRSGRA